MLTFSMIYFSMLTLWCIWLKAFTQSWPRVAPQLRMKYFVYLFCETFTVWKLSTSNIYNISILFSALTTNNPVWMWVKIGPRYPTLIHGDEMGKVIRMWSQKKDKYTRWKSIPAQKAWEPNMRINFAAIWHNSDTYVSIYKKYSRMGHQSTDK